MNIIHIGNIAREANGVGQVIANLTISQRNLGHSVVALTALKKEDQLPLFKEVHTESELSEIISETRPDIFVFHSLYIWEYIKFYKLLKKKNIPYIIQLHGALSKENYRKNHLKKRIANFLFYNSFLRNAKSVVYLNKGEYSNSIVPKINLHSVIVPNGCSQNNGCHLNPICDRIEILYLGRIELYHKGLDVFLEALRILNDNQINNCVHFSFYGTGDASHIKLFTKALEPFNNFADFYGPVYGDLKEKVYGKSHIFILTSRSEGMPMGILEALSHGLPCIVTPRTNMSDVVLSNNCGWVTDLNANDIANTIIKAVSDYRNNQFGYYSESLSASKKFSWENIAADTIHLYSKIIKTK